MVELAGCPCSNLGKLGLVPERIAAGMAEHIVELLLAEHTGCKQQAILNLQRHMSTDLAGVEGSGLVGIQSAVQPSVISGLCTRG